MASLELLATLAGVVLLGVPEQHRLSAVCSAGADNRGNIFVGERLMMTKFPFSALLVQLTAQLQSHGSDLCFRWLPRLQNMEADQLTNGDFSRFTESLRLRLSLYDFRGIVWPICWSSGQTSMRMFGRQSAANGLPQRSCMRIRPAARSLGIALRVGRICPASWMLEAGRRCPRILGQRHNKNSAPQCLWGICLRVFRMPGLVCFERDAVRIPRGARYGMKWDP